MHWSIFSIFASFIIAFSWLIRKKALKNNTIETIMFYMYIGTTISAIFFASLIKKTSTINKTNNFSKSIILLSGALLPLAAYCITTSLKTVKNPAYTSITFAVFKTLLLLLLGIYLLNSSYNKFTLFGVLLALLGVVIIVLNE